MTCNKQNPHPAIRFFKIITASSLQAGNLKLPNGFTRKHGGDVQNPVFLKPPDDIEWKIYWTKHDDGYIWFEKGWKEFASYYSLEHGHMVLFEYNTASHFEVHIFDRSTLEIGYPYHGSKNKQNNLQQILDEKTSYNKRRLKSPVSFPQLCKKLRTGRRGKFGRSSILPKLPQHVVRGHHQSQGTEFEKSKSESASKEFDVQSFDERTPCKKKRLKSPVPFPQPSKKLRTGTGGDVGRSSKLPKLPQHVKGHHQYQGTEFEYASKELDENVGGGSLEFLNRMEVTSKTTKASNRARTFTSKNPSFEVVMKPSYVGKYLLVPSEFAKRHFKNKKSDMILHVMDGRTWHVKYSLGKINAGWKKFVLDNHLKVGDVCVFELTKSQPFSLEVKIFPLGAESDQPHLPPPQESVQGDGVNGLDPARITDVESETTISECILKPISSRKVRKETHRTSKLISSRFVTNEALNQAKKFTSESPSFRVNIKPSKWRVYRQQDAPRGFVIKHFHNKKDLMF